MRVTRAQKVIRRHPLRQQALPKMSAPRYPAVALCSPNEVRMTADGRYEVSGLPEAQFESGSNGLVLKNLIRITSKQVMDEAEARALEQAMDALVRAYSETHRFTATDLCDCHRTWLGSIYEWAGRYRRVNVSKDGFPFAAAAQVPVLMDQFERDMLRRYTPCTFADRADVIQRWRKHTLSSC